MNFSTTTLTTHYRNGIFICRVADGIQNVIDKPEGMEANCNYDENSYPSTVDEHYGVELDAQIAKAVELIKDQLIAYPDEFIGVLTPRKSELDAIGEQLLQSSINDVVQVQKDNSYSALDPSRRVIVASIHSAKGLEFRAVHLIAMEFVKNFQLQRKMCYTAVTRCKTSLTIYHENSLPGYLENGIQACSAPPGEPEVNDLFV